LRRARTEHIDHVRRPLLIQRARGLSAPHLLRHNTYGASKVIANFPWCPGIRAVATGPARGPHDDSETHSPATDIAKSLDAAASLEDRMRARGCAASDGCAQRKRGSIVKCTLNVLARVRHRLRRSPCVALAYSRRDRALGATYFEPHPRSRHFLTEERCRVAWLHAASVHAIHGLVLMPGLLGLTTQGAPPLHSMLIRTPWILVASERRARRSVRPDRSTSVDEAFGRLTPNVIATRRCPDQASDANPPKLTRKLRRKPPRCRLRAAIRLQKYAKRYLRSRVYGRVTRR